jgi:hypothetical protein
MSDLIEAMAERLHASASGLDENPLQRTWNACSQGTKDNFRRHATAALAALRETHHLVPKDSIGNTDVISAPRTDRDGRELAEMLRERHAQYGANAPEMQAAARITALSEQLAVAIQQNAAFVEAYEKRDAEITALSASNSHWMQEARRLVQGNNEAMGTITALSAEVEHWKRLHAENCAAYDKAVAEREHFRSALSAEVAAYGRSIVLKQELIEALNAEVERWRSCAQYDATMEGPVFKGWDRSALDRCRLQALGAKP